MAAGLTGAARVDAILAGSGGSRRGPAGPSCMAAEAAFRVGAELRRGGASFGALRALTPSMRPFAFEGAGLVDVLLGGGGDEAARPAEVVFLGLGRGMAQFALGEGCPVAESESDGFGFAEAIARPDRAMERSGAGGSRDVGAGRALWFLHAGAVARLRAAIHSTTPERQSALWHGVGRAAVFTGGGGEHAAEHLLRAAGEHAASVEAGMEGGALTRRAWERCTGAWSAPAGEAACAVVPGIAAIRGWGGVSAAGDGLHAAVEHARAGTSAIAPVRRFPTQAFTAHCAGLVPGNDAPMGEAPDGSAQALALRFGRQALRSALAGLAPTEGVTAMVVGSNVEDRPARLDALFACLADEFAVDGPRYVVSTACASGASALGHALELLERGDADRVLVGGVDVITPRVFAGFSVLGALSDQGAPFSRVAGMTLGEGAAFLVLERAGPMDASCVLGYGLASDAFHETQPAPDGHGVAAAITAALAHAGLEPADVRYVNAHGTGTEVNDGAEWRGIRAGLGGAAPPTSSSKGLFGHTQGAAGALEVAYTLECRALGVLPPTTGLVLPRIGAPPDPVPTMRIGDTSTFVSCSSAFGGVNVAVVVGPGKATPRPSKSVSVAGVGMWGPSRSGEPPARPGAEHLPRGVDPDSLGSPVAWLCGAIERALRASGIRLDRATRGRTGMVLGSRGILPRDGAALGVEIRANGLGGVAGSTFIRSLVVTPAGAAAKAFGLLGPLDVVVAGRDSGAVALVHAASLLASRPELALMIAATVDDGEAEGDWSGGVAVVLRHGAGTPLQGWALGGSPEAARSRLGTRFPAHVMSTVTADPTDASAGSSLAAMFPVIDAPGASGLVGGATGLGWAFATGARP